MQLTNLVAPVATPVAAPVAAPIQSQATATPGVPAAPAAVSAPVAVEESGFGAKLGAKLLGSVSGAKLGASSAQQRALESQQLLGAISAGLGERFSMIAKSVWSALRGTEAQTAPQEAAAVVAAAAE